MGSHTCLQLFGIRPDTDPLSLVVSVVLIFEEPRCYFHSNTSISRSHPQCTRFSSFPHRSQKLPVYGFLLFVLLSFENIIAVLMSVRLFF